MRLRASSGITFVLTALLLSVGGCGMYADGWWPRATAERTVELERPLEAGSTLGVSTASGSIDVAGQEAGAAHVVATIRAHAASEEEAQELAEQVTVRFEEHGSKVEVKADRPRRRGR